MTTADAARILRRGEQGGESSHRSDAVAQVFIVMLIFASSNSQLYVHTRR